jgi:hypothetical protein
LRRSSTNKIGTPMTKGLGGDLRERTAAGEAEGPIGRGPQQA